MGTGKADFIKIPHLLQGERLGEREWGEKKQTRVYQTKHFSCPGIICFPSNDVCVALMGAGFQQTVIAGRAS